MRISQEEACERLLQGDVVAIPTETVYGLAAALAHTQSIEQIFALKNRPGDNPLIIHLADASDLEFYATNMPPGIDELIDNFWPGPLTLVLPIDPGTVPFIARAGLPTAAFRIPKHPIARAMTRHVGALVAPSANLSGRPSATRPDHVEQDFGLHFPVVDGGTCEKGVESTILYFTDSQWHVLRLGALAAEVFSPFLGYTPALAKNEKILSPGQHYRHYSPKAKLFLGSGSYPGFPPVVVGYSDRIYAGAEKVFSLGPTTSVEVVSQNLYNILRELDERQIPAAWVDINIPEFGLWRTIAERLTRAAVELSP